MEVNNYHTIATKIGTESKAAFERLCKKRNISSYELIQMVVDTLIRVMDDRHNLSPDLERIIRMFEGMEGWHDAFTLVDPDNRKEVSEATYYMNDGDGKKHGCRAVLVSKPFMGNPQATNNIYTIAERMFCLVFPTLYTRLRLIGVEENLSNVIDTISLMVADRTKDADTRAIREMFADNDRSEFGTKPAAAPYKRKKHVTPDMFNNQKTEEK